LALETLKGIESIGGFKIGRVEWERGEYPVEVCEANNAITFQIQNGPIKEKGVNGCQVDTMIEAAKVIIEGLNAKFPCRENACAITKLDEALMWLRERTRKREARGVEGTNQA
jgi:hypothetical protein